MGRESDNIVILDRAQDEGEERARRDAARDRERVARNRAKAQRNRLGGERALTGELTLEEWRFFLWTLLVSAIGFLGFVAWLFLSGMRFASGRRAPLGRCQARGCPKAAEGYLAIWYSNAPRQTFFACREHLQVATLAVESYEAYLQEAR